MTDTATVQSLFFNALTSEHGLPHDLVKEATSRNDRLAVYRNNFRVTLRDVLADRFPVTKQLVGEEFFNAMAGEYVRANPPASPMLIEYGADFPEFIANFPPARSLPYLSDVARLEWLIHDAANAADGDSLDPADLADLDPDIIDYLEMAPHPSVRMLTSTHSVHDIWMAHQDEIDKELRLKDEPSHLLICRPDYKVSMWPHTQAEFLTIRALYEGARLMDAFAEGLAADPAMSLDLLLANAFSRGYFRSARLSQDAPIHKNGDHHVR